ncbi:hypothetical protein GCM10017624_11060 [Azotobacter vinelandii]|nr:hypothetical protein GCM10017624_11060 [Azotobacter vinelandii]
MVQPFVDRLEDLLDLGKVANPAGVGIDLALDIDGHAEGVAVQPATFVSGRNPGEAVSRFEYEFFE